MADIESRLATAREALGEALGDLPNFVHPEVPEGGEEDFRELRRVGEPRRFDFAAADHLELGQKLGLFDFEAGARVTGQKFYFLTGKAVLLDLALQRFALELLEEEGFQLFTTP